MKRVKKFKPVSWIILVEFALMVGLFLVAQYAHKPANVTSTAAIAAPQCVQSDLTLQFRCYESYFNTITDTHGAKTTLTKLDELRQKDSYLQTQCHPLIHSIGRHAYKFYGSVSEASKYATEICWSGYYHGIMEAYMAQFNDTELMAKMDSICTPTDKPYSFDYYNCLHGLGHGVTIRFENDIFKALPFCKAITKDWERQSCYSGVFMQNIVVDGFTHQSINIRADDPIYPCDAVEHDQKQPCYLMVTSNVLKTVNYDYTKAFAACDKVESEFVPTCYQSMGRDISGNTLLDTPKSIAYCAIGQTKYQPMCITGAVKNDVFNDRNTVKANELCAAVNQALKAPCEQAKSEAASTL